MQDRKEQYEAFMKSEFGIYIIKTLGEISDALLHEAAQKNTADEAYGLIKEAGGVIKAIEHFKTGSVL